MQYRKARGAAGQVKKAKKRANAAHPSYGKRTYPYSSANRTPSDGHTLLVSSYFEVDAAQPDTGALYGCLAYIIKCDPLACLLTTGQGTPAGAEMTISKRDGVNNPINDGAHIQFGRLDSFKHIYRQYRINSITAKITTSRVLGLDNPLICLTDRGDASPVVTVGTCMNQAHKSKCLTESDRSMQYGWRPSTIQEKEYHMVSDASSTSGNNHWIKVLQECEAVNGGALKHKIELTASVTFKDSKSEN